MIVSNSSVEYGNLAYTLEILYLQFIQPVTVTYQSLHLMVYLLEAFKQKILYMSVLFML